MQWKLEHSGNPDLSPTPYLNKQTQFQRSFGVVTPVTTRRYDGSAENMLKKTNPIKPNSNPIYIPKQPPAKKSGFAAYWSITAM